MIGSSGGPPPWQCKAEGGWGRGRSLARGGGGREEEEQVDTSGFCAAQLCEHGSLQAASELAKPGEDVTSSQVGGEGQSEKTKASRPMGEWGGGRGGSKLAGNLVLSQRG